MITIVVEVEHDENFTASGLMYRYAKFHSDTTFSYSRYGEARLTIAGVTYAYDHWKFTPRKNISTDFVTLTLREVRR